MKNKVTEFDLKAAFKALDEIEIPAATKEVKKENLNESIRKQANTDCLLEDYYDLNNKKDLEEAAEDRESEIAKAKLARIEKIVDLDAKSEEDLQPSYVGKNIIQCPQCMNLFYKDPDDIEKSEENPDVVNVGEKCQHCGNENGYTLIGKVGEVSDEERNDYDGGNELDQDFGEPTKEIDAEGTGKGADEIDTKDELDLDFGEPTKDEEDVDLDKVDTDKKDEDKDDKKKEESFTKDDATNLKEDIPTETNKPELNEAKEESGKCESGCCESGACESGLNEDLNKALKEAISAKESGCESGKCESGCESGDLNEQLNEAIKNAGIYGSIKTTTKKAKKDKAESGLTESKKDESGKEESGIDSVNVKEKVELPNYNVKIEQKKDKVKVEVKPIKENLEEGCKKDKKEKKAEELKEEAENKKAEDLTKKLADWNAYIEYLRNQIKGHEEALAKADNAFVKAAIQKTIDAYKEDLDKALPEQVKAEAILNGMPNPEDIKNESLEADKKKDLKEEVINKDPNNAVVPCKVNKVIAHCKDEEPVDCKGEKKPLEKPLTESNIEQEINSFINSLSLTEAKEESKEASEMERHTKIAKDFKKRIANLGEDISNADIEKMLDSKEFKEPVSHAETKEILNDSVKANNKNILEALDEIEDASFEKVINESLTNVYENIESFSLTSCSLKDKKDFIVEGTINFRSGNKAKVNYIFKEAINKEDKIELTGLNESLAKDGKFVLTCAVKENKLIAESLAYNYKIGDSLVEGLVK